MALSTVRVSSKGGSIKLCRGPSKARAICKAGTARRERRAVARFLQTVSSYDTEVADAMPMPRGKVSGWMW